MPAQAAPARAGNRNHPTRRLRRIDAPEPIHPGIRAGQPGCPRDRFLSIGRRLTFQSAATKGGKRLSGLAVRLILALQTRGPPAQKLDQVNPDPAPVPETGREPRSPISGYLNRTKPSKAAILPCSGASGFRPSLPAMPIPASAGRSVPARRAWRRAYRHADRAYGRTRAIRISL